MIIGACLGRPAKPRRVHWSSKVVVMAAMTLIVKAVVAGVANAEGPHRP